MQSNTTNIDTFFFFREALNQLYGHFGGCKLVCDAVELYCVILRAVSTISSTLIDINGGM